MCFFISYLVEAVALGWSLFCCQEAQPAKPVKFGADEKSDMGDRFGRHRNPIMPDDRRENDVMKPVQPGGVLDFGKLGKFPHAVDSNAQAGQMEKPMQIAEPHIQQEEDQVLAFALLC